jgi:hypothetical protein
MKTILEALIQEIIKEELEIPADLIEPEVRRLVKDCYELCKAIMGPMFEGYPNAEQINKIKSLFATAQEQRQFYVKNNNVNRRLFETSILSPLAELAQKTEFKNRPTFFGKEKYSIEIFNLCSNLKKNCENYRIKSKSLDKRYG